MYIHTHAHAHTTNDRVVVLVNGLESNRRQIGLKFTKIYIELLTEMPVQQSYRYIVVGL
jgi:hypothetical protein